MQKTSVTADSANVITPTLTQSASAGAAWIAFQMIGLQATSLVVFSIIAHYVGPAEFGIISVVYSLIFSTRILLFDNIAVYVVRHHNPTDVEYSTIFWITASLAAFVTVILFLSAGYVGPLLKANNATSVIQTMSVMIFFMGLGRTHEAWMARNFLFRPLAFRGIIGAIGGGVVGIAMAIRGHGVFALVYQQIVGSVLTLCLMWSVTPWRPSFIFSRNVALSLGALLRTTTPTALLNAITQNCDVFLVTYYFGISATGFYSVSKRLKWALQLVAATPIIAVSLPSLANAQKDRERLRRVFIKGLMIISASCTPVFVGAAAVAPQLIGSTFGPAWLPASPIFLIMALAAVPAVLINFYDSVYLIFNRPRWSLLASSMIIVLSILSLFAVPSVDTSLTAVPFALPYLLVFPIMSLIVTRLLCLPLRKYVDALAPCFISASLMFAVVTLSDANIHIASVILKLCLSVCLGAIVYVGCMTMIGQRHLALMLELATGLTRRQASDGVTR